MDAVSGVRELQKSKRSLSARILNKQKGNINITKRRMCITDVENKRSRKQNGEFIGRKSMTGENERATQDE